MRINKRLSVGLVLSAMLANLLAQQPGAKLWEFTTQGPIHSSPAVGEGGAVYIGSMDGKLYAVNPDGSKKWEYAAGAPIFASPAIAYDGTIYVGTTGGKFHAVRPNGTSKWSLDLGSSIYCSAAVGLDGTVYVGSWDTKMYAIRPDRTIKWTYTTGNQIYSSPAIGRDGAIYFGSRDKKLYALLTNGIPKWTFTTRAEIDSSPAIGADGTVYIASLDGSLYAISSEGTNKWEFKTNGKIYSSPSIGPDGAIYVLSNDGKLYAISPAGKEVYSRTNGVSLASPYSSPAVAADGVVYIGASDVNYGNLYANQAGNTWVVLSTSAKIQYSSPAISADGTVYIGSEDGKLYAVKATSGLAVSPWPMFRRDIRHAASEFAWRQLPESYSAGHRMTVRVRIEPPPEVNFFVVQEQPPAGWTVDAISHSGWYDPANNIIRFETFYDSSPRTLTYEVTPPMGDSGVKLFGGLVIASGFESIIGGHNQIKAEAMHPADYSPDNDYPVDRRLTISELASYAASWKKGLAWPFNPNPIPVSYVTRAIALWRGGEFYRNDATVSAPLSWTNTAPTLPFEAQPFATSPSGTGNCAAVSELPESHSANTPLTVTISAIPSDDTTVYAVEDQPPLGWTVLVNTIPANGVWEPATGKVKWGPFFDNEPRVLTYQVVPPAGASGVVVFNGVVSFDGLNIAIAGQRQTMTGPAPTYRFVQRQLPIGYSPGLTFVVTLHVTPPPNTTVYVVDDQPPAGWAVGAMSETGMFNAQAGRVEFGPFFDADPRTLTYEVTALIGENGVKSFSGMATSDVFQSLISGDSQLPVMPFHPAEGQAGDNYMSIGEMTSYSAAWKRGSSWPVAPTPIPVTYLTNAIGLWRLGEAYSFQFAITNAPYYWVNNPAPINLPAPLPLTEDTNQGIAIAELPLSYQANSPVQIKITVTPATNNLVYAVEDQPPAGWAISQISHNGLLDSQTGKLKWGPFFDNTPRTLVYQTTSPTNAASMAEFNGVASFDGINIAIAGQRTSALVLPPPILGQRHLPSNYSPGLKFVVQLEAAPPANTAVYIVEDRIPAGWSVGEMSETGVFDANTGTVDFGPFFDDAPRTLTYELTPPMAETGTKQFTGLVLTGITDGVLGGDTELPFAPLHPADIDTGDRFMTITEMTAYGAAWKRDKLWPVDPVPILLQYLTNAISLWRGGEYYGYVTNITNAPAFWVNMPTAITSYPAPTATASTNFGVATAEMPDHYHLAAPITVMINVKPSASVLVYAIEEQPPAGWSIAQVSHNGSIDSATGKVKFGPFFDKNPRILTYTATPPINATGAAGFSGVVSFDGNNVAITGQRQSLLWHPADLNAGDEFITIAELTAYGNAWYRGIDWPVEPSFILNDYVTNAINLWRGGEVYHYDESITNAPFFWVNPAPSQIPPDAAPAKATIPLATNSTAVAGLPAFYKPSTPVDVTITVTPSVDTMVYAVEDQPPAGWRIATNSISANGAFDNVNRKVKWGPFFDNSPRALSYQALPNTNSTGTVTFSGTASFNGANAAIGGARQISSEQPPVLALRQLAYSSYIPGVSMTVTLQVTPPTNATVYVVQDRPPTGWLITEVSQGGLFNSASGRVEFGPFFGAAPRTLTYKIAAPQGETGAKQFSGAVSSDVVEGTIGGNDKLSLLPLHPADNSSGDTYLTIAELTAYGTSVKPWLDDPSLIPFANLTNAIALWRNGEVYRYDSALGSPPLCWISATNRADWAPVSVALPGTTTSTAVADMPKGFNTNEPITVIITVTPAPNTVIYAAQDKLPGGWSVSAINEGGSLDTLNQKIKWGPFFDNAARTLSYQVVPPATATGTIVFDGVASFNGVNVPITGQRQTKFGVLTAPIGMRQFSTTNYYSPGMKLLVTLRISPPTNINVYVVEDQPPAGWVVTTVSAGGRYDSVSGKVKFETFFDSSPRALSYETVPPLGDTGPKQFSGLVSVDGIESLIGGQNTLQFVPRPFHPADSAPLDGRLAIDEITAYDVAWKQSASWPTGPSPIPVNYLTRAIELWRSGEFYRYDSNIIEAPLYWVNMQPSPEQISAAASKPSTTDTNYGTALSDLPRGYNLGTPLTVRINVTLQTNVLVYAVEDSLPSGWVASQISDNGLWDNATRKVKWGPYLSNAAKTFAYEATPTTNALKVAGFAGVVSFNGASVALAGQRQTRLGGLCSVIRQLPGGYSPGRKLTVRLDATPPGNVDKYMVEDQPPAGWKVESISHSGAFDQQTGRVKFGPFLDAVPRSLTYEITSPLAETDEKSFEGSVFTEGLESAIGGNSILSFIPLVVIPSHPADNNLQNYYVTIGEVTKYGAAWIGNDAWPTGPVPITVEYMRKSKELWLGGELYGYDSKLGEAPACWVNTQIQGRSAPTVVGGSDTTRGMAVAELPYDFEAGNPITVSIQARPATNNLAYAVEDKLPAGWTASNISGDGQYDALNNKVKWGPFYDAQPRVLSYQASPSTNVIGTLSFSGVASFDGDNVAVAGHRNTRLSPANVAPALNGTRKLPSSYFPLVELQVELNISTPTNVSFYVVEDRPPAGWPVTGVSDGGRYDQASGTVRFENLFGPAPRTLTYSVTPPAWERGTNVFVGSISAGGLVNYIGGSNLLIPAFLHPADNNPADSRLSINEITAYDTAWKTSAAWPSGPSPIPIDYLTRAIDLWQHGELYNYDTNIVNSPLWWINTLSAQPLALPQVSTPAPVNCAATAAMPDRYNPGEVLTVSIIVIPSTNTIVYTVQDQPPTGWSVSQITSDGLLDVANNIVKWGPFYGNKTRTLTYDVTVPIGATGAAAFNGLASFGGANLAIAGQRTTALAGAVAPTSLAVKRFLPAAGLELELVGGAAGQQYEIQASTDLVNWTSILILTNSVGPVQFSDPGATNHNVRFYRAISP